MQYKTNKDLPENVSNVLASHAQDIYREAFNHAWEQYANPQERRDDTSCEETAHKVAWAAVKHKYEKAGNTWTVKK
jgi:cation transport regulator